jgi:hypothetical protein
MEALMQSVCALPFPIEQGLSLFSIISCHLQVYVSNGVLAYAIHVPLVNRGQFDIYKLVPI